MIPQAGVPCGVFTAPAGVPPPDKSHTMTVPMDFVLVTHTRWSESPRIRHQVARLLRDAGHRVLFVERADPAWRAHQSLPIEVERNIWTATPTQWMHHQLRVLPWMHRLEGNHAGSQICRLVRAWEPSTNATIINFTHDGWFLRRVFPRNRLITLINDDFEAQSRLPFRSHITWTLERTCRESDQVLAVSVPLQKKLSRWADTQLFLPWATVPYRAPVSTPATRDTLLFWGYVDNAIDLDVVQRLATELAAVRPNFSIRFVGPTQTKGARERIIQTLRPFPNISVAGPTALDDLPLDRTLAALLPYRRSDAVDAVTLANKSMQLLARGLPLLISGMPAFIQREFVVRLDGAGGFTAAIAACESGFDRMQVAIRGFCDQNSPESRLGVLQGPLPSETSPVRQSNSHLSS